MKRRSEARGEHFLGKNLLPSKEKKVCQKKRRKLKIHLKNRLDSANKKNRRLRERMREKRKECLGEEKKNCLHKKLHTRTRRKRGLGWAPGERLLIILEFLKK